MEIDQKYVEERKKTKKVDDIDSECYPFLIIDTDNWVFEIRKLSVLQYRFLGNTVNISIFSNIDDFMALIDDYSHTLDNDDRLKYTYKKGFVKKILTQEKEEIDKDRQYIINRIKKGLSLYELDEDEQ